MANQQRGKWLHAALALVLGGGTIYGLSNSIGPVPALASALHPVKGIWTDAAQDKLLPKTEQVHVPSLNKSVAIVFEQDGTPHIKAESDREAFLAIGYLHAKFRLFQMDLMRRQGTGTLAEVLGASALESDKIQREVNLTRTAETEWAALKQGDELHDLLTAYADGVNQVIDEQTAAGNLPMMFKMMGYQPKKWQPQDTLVIKGVLAQMMSLNTMPATYQLFADSLGYDRTMELLPILPVSEQHPYDPGPYTKHDPKQMPLSAEHYYQEQDKAKQGASTSPGKSVQSKQTGGILDSLSEAATSASVLSIVERLNNVHMYAIHESSNSNAWAANGKKTEAGQALLAGDPHLDQTMPSIWYQIQVEAPGYQFSGASVPGIPFTLVGRNENISWTLTNGQNQQTFFYKEQTDEAHPNQYFWRGQWRDMTVTKHDIAVKGAGTVSYEIKSTIHGPIVNRRGQTMAMNWMGAIPSQSVQSLMKMMKAKNYEEFRGALSTWSAPIMNFVYADKAGNIGAIAAGTFAVFGQDTKPWMPMRGTGEDDIVGKIPYEDIPQTYNPPSGMLGSGNQRQVGADYPYYVGSSLLFDTGDRANRMYEFMEDDGKLSADDFAKMQADVKDKNAEAIVPLLLKALQGTQLNEQEQKVVSDLSSWKYQMAADSVGASIWWTFWEKYVNETYAPWWEKSKVPVDQQASLKIRPEHTTLTQKLKVWTMTDPDNEYFSNPITGEKRDANAVMITAFHAAVKELQTKFGDDTSKWQWEKLHKRTIPSLTKIPALGYPAKGAEGGAFTLNVAPEATSKFGPTFRMITDWGTGKSVGTYPGGQSENPVSPWYEDRVATWWSNQHTPMISFEEAEKAKAGVRWTLMPSNE